MNLHQRGADLINHLKDHLLEVLATHPDGQPKGKGVLEAEIARRAGLHTMGTGELDHTCGEILRLLHKDGKIELAEVSTPTDKDSLWRLIG